VSASWVHERGAAGSPPPVPPDVHALQSYFWDPETRRWIRTLLAPLGQQLAAKWPGAHREPDVALGSDDATRLAAIQKAVPPKKTNPLPIAIVGIVLLASIGGAVVASQQGQSSATPTAGVPTVAPNGSAPAATGAPVASPSASASVEASASAAPTVAPPVVVRTPAPTPRPATPQPTIALPPGIGRATLADGSVFVYTGPTLALRNTQMLATFTAVTAQGRALPGTVTIILGDQRGSSSIVASIENGKVAASLNATPPSGQYPLSVLYNGQLAQVTLVTIR
jgi:hypothetical protein